MVAYSPTFHTLAICLLLTALCGVSGTERPLPRSCHVGVAVGWELSWASGGAPVLLHDAVPGSLDSYTVDGFPQSAKVEAAWPSYGLGPELHSTASAVFSLLRRLRGHFRVKGRHEAWHEESWLTGDHQTVYLICPNSSSAFNWHS